MQTAASAVLDDAQLLVPSVARRGRRRDLVARRRPRGRQVGRDAPAPLLEPPAVDAAICVRQGVQARLGDGSRPACRTCRRCRSRSARARRISRQHRLRVRGSRRRARRRRPGRGRHLGRLVRRASAVAGHRRSSRSSRSRSSTGSRRSRHVHAGKGTGDARGGVPGVRRAALPGRADHPSMIPTTTRMPIHSTISASSAKSNIPVSG